jgi:hypothetical protein
MLVTTKILSVKATHPLTKPACLACPAALFWLISASNATTLTEVNFLQTNMP